MDEPKNLQAHASNVTSQFGEDGILAEILRRLGEGKRRCIEFGAWDGKHFSNTWRLWHEQDWFALLIEGDAKRCSALARATRDFAKVTTLSAFVSPTGENRLDNLIRNAGWLECVDVVSIDIDGDDYHVFASVKECAPRVVLVEFNPTCPPGGEVIQAPGGNFGCSATSLLRLAREKGYALAACTDTNLILVRQDEFFKLEMAEVQLEDVLPRQHLAYVMTDYSGNAYLNRIPVYKDKSDSSGVGSLLKRRPRTSRMELGQAIPVRLLDLPR